MKYEFGTKLLLIIRRPLFYVMRGVRKLDNCLTIWLLGRIGKHVERNLNGTGANCRLIFILENVGDTVSATPVLNRLDGNDWVVCTKYNWPVIEMLGLRNVLVLSRDPGMLDFLKVIMKLYKKDFSSSVILDSSGSGAFGVLASRFLKTGTIYSGFDTKLRGDSHVTEICADDGQTDVLSLSKVSIAKEVFFAKGNDLKYLEKKIRIDCGNEFGEYRDFVGVHIGGVGSVGYSISRQYPHYHIFSLVQILLARGYKVLITGDHGDSDLFRKYSKILEGEKEFTDLSGKLSIKQLSCLLKGLKCYITPDNGTLHLAQAVGCKRIYALLGPTDPAIVRGKDTEIISLGLPCSPCLTFLKFPKQCINSENNACLRQLLPESVLDRVMITVDGSLHK